jgi:prolyl-tRNA editing enzyme YbaK/EbsC (Cys-tRNA(Pro) deacylase)
VQRVQEALAAFGVPVKVVQLPSSARTAAEAARAVGCQIDQIAKSLVFKGQKTGRPFLVVASGRNRVDEKRLAELIAEPVRPAEPDFVRERTGFAIGGVPPIGHVEEIETFLDEDLVTLGEIWAAAGAPNTVFCIRFADLVAVAGGRVVRLAEAR